MVRLIALFDTCAGERGGCQSLERRESGRPKSLWTPFGISRPPRTQRPVSGCDYAFICLTGPARSLPELPSSDSVGRASDAEDHENNGGASFGGLRRLRDTLELTYCSDQDLPRRQTFEPLGRAACRRGSCGSDPIELMERRKLTGLRSAAFHTGLHRRVACMRDPIEKALGST